MSLPSRSLVALVVVLTGCAATPDDAPRALSESDKSEFRDAWGTGEPVRTAPRVRSTAVASGRAPLSYLTEQPGTVWVTDASGRQWGPLELPARSVVRVSAETGVMIGDKKFPGDPGAAVFTIHLGVTATEAYRSGQRQGGAAPRARDGGEWIERR
ncbi:MAG TPA: hypothetical protein VF796_00565 [Humisphaera sp.]